MSRVISDLKSARAFDGWPDSIPRHRARGVKALGRRYEAAVARQLGSDATRGQWWTFRDANGPGLCQTDLIIPGDTWIVVLECKHTWIADGMMQLQYLYLPVVGMATGKRVVGIQVCKHLVPYAHSEVCESLEEAVIAAKRNHNRLVTLHWRGFGPMLQSKELANV